MYLWSKKRNKKESNRRGQFTLFIIVGLVIFSVFGFALYARAKIINAQLSTQVEKQIKEYIDRNAISQYVTSCLDAVSEDVILKAALQGGTFNFTNKIENKDYVEFYDKDYERMVNVSIIVKPNFVCPDATSQLPHITYPEPTYSGIPDYPYVCGYVPITELESVYYKSHKTAPCKNHCTKNNFLDYSGFFGINSLNRLCSNDGANKILTDDSDILRSNYISCDYYSNKDKSMQKYIEEQINHDLTICLNFTEILKRSPSNITVTDTPISEVQFKNNKFSVKVVYPFTLTMRNHPPITKLIDFSVEKDIAFKELYEYTYELINYDVKKAEFDIINDRMKVVSKGNKRTNINIYTSNYEVELIRGDINNNFIDVVRVIDTEHKVRDLPLVINVGFINRRPVLDYIHYASASTKFDILAVENDTININPFGYDPDNDYIIYDYGLWREDYIDMYNYTDDKCKNPPNLEYIIENCSKINVSALSAYGTPNNWTNSTEYKKTQKNATYKVTAEDIGFHKVKVSIVDTLHNLEDYQNVRILVFDLPIIKIEGNNYYSDVEDNRASYEDIYTLDGSASTVSALGEAMGYSQFSTFFWLDQKEPFDRLINIITDEDKKLTMPNATNGSNPIEGVTILNIKEYIFKDKGSTPVIHDIALTGTVQTLGISNMEYYAVNVTQCLNHSSDEAPYPYNNNPSSLTESLQADHRCCSDDYTYEGTNIQCYNMTAYGLNKNFINYSTRNPSPATIPGGITYQKLNGNSIANSGTINNMDSEYSNDVFKQYFTRYCSGDRGNICTGYGTEIRRVVATCDDTNYGTPAVERCSGPPISNLNTPSSIETGCVKYGGGYTTFEKKIGISGATGKCTGNTRNFSNRYTFGPGKYIAYGMCDSSDGKCKPTDFRCSYANYEYYGYQAQYKVDRTCDGGSINQVLKNTCTITPYLRDRCYDCVLMTYPYCKSDNGCTAASECEGKYQYGYTALGTCNKAGSSGIKDRCSNVCQIEDESNTCSMGVDCTTTPNCVGKSPNSASISGYGICNSNCQEEVCANNFKADTINNVCYTQCSVTDNKLNINYNYKCTSGKVCCFGGQSCGDLGCQEAAI